MSNKQTKQKKRKEQKKKKNKRKPCLSIEPPRPDQAGRPDQVDTPSRLLIYTLGTARYKRKGIVPRRIMACAWTCEDRIVDRTSRQDQTRPGRQTDRYLDRQTDRPAPSIVIHRGLLSIVTFSDGGVLIFFLNSFAGRQVGRQAGSLSCLV